jgi:hypothetical protein
VDKRYGRTKRSFSGRGTLTSLSVDLLEWDRFLAALGSSLRSSSATSVREPPLDGAGTGAAVLTVVEKNALSSLGRDSAGSCWCASSSLAYGKLT